MNRVEPMRPLEWPPLVEAIAAHLPAEAEVYLVGGIVRDALRGRQSTDVDLVTSGSGLDVARHLADALGGAYYPVDRDRGTGRAILDEGQIDVASYRGPSLEADLRGRDFTINAIAVDMVERDMLIDPLGGQDDLLRHKVLRLCSPESINSDPVRALRAIRMSLQFQLRIAREVTAAIREGQGRLVDADGVLHQPERTRDELLKITGKASAASAFKVLHTLGTLDVILPGHQAGEHIRLVQAFEQLVRNISRQRDDNTAANVLYGVAVMILDRYRAQLNEHLLQPFGDGSTRLSLLLLALLFDDNRAHLGDVLRLSGVQRSFLEGIDTAFSYGLLPETPPTPREIHRYYRVRGEEGVEATLLGLAAYLAAHLQPDPVHWGHLLDNIAAPLLGAYFRDYTQVIAPPPLVTGDDLIAELGIKRGPQIGALLAALSEEQAAGTITTRQDALDMAGELHQKK